jgi:hypothetical protein
MACSSATDAKPLPSDNLPLSSNMQQSQHTRHQQEAVPNFHDKSLGSQGAPCLLRVRVPGKMLQQSQQPALTALRHSLHQAPPPITHTLPRLGLLEELQAPPSSQDRTQAWQGTGEAPLIISTSALEEHLQPCPHTLPSRTPTEPSSKHSSNHRKASSPTAASLPMKQHIPQSAADSIHS